MTTKTANQLLGEHVRQIRERFRMSQAELASRLSRQGSPMSQVTVGRLERGERPTTVDDLEALAHVFGVSMTYLVTPLDTGVLTADTVYADLISDAGPSTPNLDEWKEYLASIQHSGPGATLLDAMRAQRAAIPLEAIVGERSAALAAFGELHMEAMRRANERRQGEGPIEDDEPAPVNRGTLDATLPGLRAEITGDFDRRLQRIERALGLDPEVDDG